MVQEVMDAATPLPVLGDHPKGDALNPTEERQEADGTRHRGRG